MGLKEFYYNLEDKYFEMLDNLEEKGINLYKLVDPLEKNGIPTFPIFSVIILALFALIIFLLLTSFVIKDQPNGTTIRFVDDTSNSLSEIALKATLDDQPRNLLTDKDGYVYLEGLDKTKIYDLKLVDSVYMLTNNQEFISIIPEKEGGYLVNLERTQNTTTKTISFKTQSGSLLTSELDVTFSCTTNDFEKEVIVTSGEYTLNNVPKNCGSLEVYVAGRNDYEVNISDIGTTGEITFSENNNYATLIVTVKDKDLPNPPLPNMSVTIYDIFGKKVQDGQTNQNGIFTSELVVVSKQYKIIISDPIGIYSGVSELDYQNGTLVAKQITNGLNSQEIKLKKDVVGFIKIKVKDKTTGNYLEGVTAKLSKNAAIIDTKLTDETGYVQFAIKENVSYSLTLDKDGYLLSTQTISISANILEIQLKSMEQSTTGVLNVGVVDKDVQPIEYATVKIWDALDNSVVKIVTTDVYGRITISNLDPNTTYFAEAITGEFSGKSNNFIVKEREATDLSVVVAIGQGTYNLTIIEADGTPVQATIKVYDASKNKEMPEKTTETNETGLAVIPVRADKSVYFVIEKEDGTRIISKQYSVDAESMLQETIVIPTSISSSANIEFIGYFASNGDQLTSVGPGQSATARFILNVDKKYLKAVAHIRTGEGEICDSKTHSVSEDSVYIKQIRYAGSKVLGSINYTPCLGESKDLISIVRKDAKWFNVTIDNPLEGSYIIDADIVVTDTATSNQAIFFRAEYQQGSSVLRNPQDNVLGTSVSSVNKQALYAYAKKLAISVGDSTGCDNGVCYSFSFKEKTTGLEKRVIDKFTAKDGTDYKFNFRLNLQKPATDAVMIITTAGQTIKLNSYTITSGGDYPITDTDFSNIPLGNILANGTVNGEVDLSVVNDISDELTITILSNGDTIFAKKILFDLKPSKQLTVDILPKTIVPYIPNVMVVGVTGDTNLNLVDASVFVRINTKPIIDGKTNKEGAYVFTLPSTNVNDTVEITVRKQGYRTSTTKLLVTENLISTIPEKLEIQLDISKAYSDKSNIILMNNTVLPLTITNVKSNIESEYIKITSNSQGVTLEPNSQVGLEISTKLTENGIDLMTQKVIKGSLLLSVNEPTLGKTWVVEIPLTIRITFGNGVDSTDCLTIDPEETTLRVESTNDLEYSIKLKNTCTVDEVPTDLGRIFISTDYKNTKKLGDFYVVVSGSEKKLELDEKIEVLNKIVAGKTADVKLIFKVNSKAKSGVSAPIIKLSSNRPNVNGIDIIESQHKPKVILNNYSSCIDTPSTPIVVPYCQAYGMLGYGSVSNTQTYTSLLNSNQYQNSGTPPQSYYATNLSAPNGINPQFYNQFPYNDFRENMNGYPNSSFSQNGQFGCQSAQVQIKNNCYEELALQFNALAGVTITTESEMIIKKGESKLLGLQGAQVLGQYKIAMSAKPNDDTIEEYTYVKDISVIVNRPVDILPEDCITVNPTEFDFSGIDSKPQKLLVVNTCYDAGYALINLKVLNPNELKVGDIQFFSIGDVNADLKPKKTYRMIDGKTTEIMSIEVRRNPEINEKTLRTDYNRSAAKTVTNIRKDYFDLGNAINLKAMLAVGYSTPRLSASELEQEIVLKDNLQWLGYLDKLPEDTSAPTLDGKQPETPSTVPSTTPVDVTVTIENQFPEFFSNSQALGEGECYDPKGNNKLGFTGEDNFSKFGFNRLLFTYNADEINHNTCDYGRVYCDQDQLRIAMSKKADLYMADNTIQLDGTNFRKENNKVAANPYLVDENPLDRNAIEAEVAKVPFAQPADPNTYLQQLKGILETVPVELRKFTIIEITVVSNADLSTTNIANLVKTVSDNNVNTVGTIYQFTVDSFLRSENKLETRIASTTPADKKIIAEFLKQYLTTMEIYYGDTVSSFIINAKTYGKLNEGITKDIFTRDNFLVDSWKFNLSTSSSIKEINTPGTYVVTIDKLSNNSNTKTTTYSVQKIDDSKKLLDYYNNSAHADFKKNIFFTNPTNAFYYNYTGVPFKNGIGSGPARITNIISNYNDWTTVQDGYILTIPATHSSITFKDIRPIQALATSDYLIEYISNGKINTLTNPNKRDTIFAFLNLNDNTKGIAYQLKMSSKSSMKFNVTPEMPVGNGSYNYIYGISRDLTVNNLSTFSKEETSTVTNMMNGIQTNTMCFNFNNSNFTLWYNPGNTVTSNSVTNSTVADNVTSVSLTITSGTFAVDAGIAGGQTKVGVVGETITMNLQEKKLSGTVKFATGDKDATINITSGTAKITGNVVELNISGKVPAGIMTITVKTSGTLNTSASSTNIDGTYTITPGQTVQVNNTTLIINNINYQ
ncbi:MAG: hypothetical protein WCX82_01050 [archaeon]|jgi:hypothetical protein